MIRLAMVIALCACADKGKKNGTDGPDDFVPSDIRLDGGDALDSDPDSTTIRLCADDSGLVVVAWLDKRTGKSALWAVVSTDSGASFGEPANVSRSSEFVESPALACDDGVAHAVWEDQRDGGLGNPNVYYARLAGLWEIPQRLGGEDLGDYRNKGPILTAVRDTVLVAWAGNPHGAFDIYSAVSHDGGSAFSVPIRLDTDAAGTAYSAAPQVLLQPNGVAHIAWEDRRNGHVDICVTRSDDGGSSFSTEVRVDAGDADSYAPRLGAEGESVYVTWHEAPAEARFDVWSAFSASAVSGFAAPVRLSDRDPGLFDNARPRVVLDQGRAHVAWFTELDGGYHVSYAALEAGAPLAPRVSIDTADATARATDPEIAQGPGGIVIAWPDDRATTDQDDVYYTFSDDGGASWSPNYRMNSWEAGAADAEGLVVALPGDAVLAAWSDDRHGTSDVFFTALPLGQHATFPEDP